MIEEIKAALAARTPGDWNVNDMDTAFSNEVFTTTTGYELYTSIASGLKIEDAHLIANAPQWLDYLLLKLKNANGMIDDLCNTVEELSKIIKDQREEINAEKEAHLDTRMELKGCDYVFKKSREKNDELKKELEEEMELHRNTRMELHELMNKFHSTGSTYKINHPKFICAKCRKEIIFNQIGRAVCCSVSYE